jgi:hypothetical protein
MRPPALVPWILWLVACASSTPPVSEPTARPDQPWEVPAGFRSETIPFPLDFAPGIAHKGFEELRFEPGFADPALPGYWSYAFVWRTEDPAELDAAALGAELTVYFRGLIDAVDRDQQIKDRDAIQVKATADGTRFKLAARVYDVFKTQRPVDLVGWAQRVPCGAGALWRFVLARPNFVGQDGLDFLVSEALCGQPVPPPRPHA